MAKNQEPSKFDQYLISEYLKFGSIEKVFSEHNYDLPVSFATYHRVLNKYKIVKSAGPNSRLSESLNFFSLLNNYKLPLEKVYFKYAPTSLKVSSNTLHRIMHHIRLGVTRREGVALVVSKKGQNHKYLVAQDNSLSSNNLGTKGDWSLPMSHTRTQDSYEVGIKRVMQQEMFVSQAISNSFPNELIPKSPKPIFYINIADIRVAVFKIEIPVNYKIFSSFKMENFKFLSLSSLKKLPTRPGIIEILNKIESERFYPNSGEIPNYISDLNLALEKITSR